MPARLLRLRPVVALSSPCSGPGRPLAADADTRLADAARARDMALVRRLLQQPGIDVNAPGQDGTPALHWAVRVNDVETAAALIRAGADPEAAESLRPAAAVAGGAERQRGHDPAAGRKRCRRERTGCRG